MSKAEMVKFIDWSKLAHLLYSTSTIPSFKIWWPIPFWAIPVKAVLLNTKSVLLLWFRSVKTTLVPDLLQTVGFLHLICRNTILMTIIHGQDRIIRKLAKLESGIGYAPESRHHIRHRLWREQAQQLQCFQHPGPVLMSHTHTPQLHHIQKTEKNHQIFD